MKLSQTPGGAEQSVEQAAAAALVLPEMFVVFLFCFVFLLLCLRPNYCRSCSLLPAVATLISRFVNYSLIGAILD